MCFTQKINGYNVLKVPNKNNLSNRNKMPPGNICKGSIDLVLKF